MKFNWWVITLVQLVSSRHTDQSPAAKMHVKLAGSVPASHWGAPSLHLVIFHMDNFWICQCVTHHSYCQAHKWPVAARSTWDKPALMLHTLLHNASQCQSQAVDRVPAVVSSSLCQCQSQAVDTVPAVVSSSLCYWVSHRQWIQYRQSCPAVCVTGSHHRPVLSLEISLHCVLADCSMADWCDLSSYYISITVKSVVSC